MTRTRHNWTTEDDKTLLEEVETMVSAKGCGIKLWTGVACRMLPIDVTPDACRSRWHRLQEAAELPPKNDRWIAVERQVQEYEADYFDHLNSSIQDLKTQIEKLVELWS